MDRSFVEQMVEVLAEFFPVLPQMFRHTGIVYPFLCLVLLHLGNLHHNGAVVPARSATPKFFSFNIRIYPTDGRETSLGRNPQREATMLCWLINGDHEALKEDMFAPEMSILIW